MSFTYTNLFLGRYERSNSRERSEAGKQAKQQERERLQREADEKQAKQQEDEKLQREIAAREKAEKQKDEYEQLMRAMVEERVKLQREIAAMQGDGREAEGRVRAAHAREAGGGQGEAADGPVGLRASNDEEKSSIVIRFPDGTRESRELPCSSKFKAVIKYVVSKGFPLNLYEIDFESAISKCETLFTHVQDVPTGLGHGWVDFPLIFSNCSAHSAYLTSAQAECG